MGVDNFYEANRSEKDLFELGIPEDTFKALNKDIQLTKTDSGHFDRVMQSDDYVIVEGLGSYAAGIRIAIQMWYNEMNENPLYAGRGNRAWFYLKGNLNALDKLAVKEEIKTTINNMSRTKSVDVIDLFEYPINNPNDLTGIVIELVVTSISDQVSKFAEEVLSYGI